MEMHICNKYKECKLAKRPEGLLEFDNECVHKSTHEYQGHSLNCREGSFAATGIRGWACPFPEDSFCVPIGGNQWK